MSIILIEYLVFSCHAPLKVLLVKIALGVLLFAPGVGCGDALCED